MRSRRVGVGRGEIGQVGLKKILPFSLLSPLLQGTEAVDEEGKGIDERTKHEQRNERETCAAGGRYLHFDGLSHTTKPHPFYN